MTLQELNARTSTARRKTFWEVFSEKYNNPSWSPRRLDYEEVGREKIYTVLTPDRIKTLFREARGKMNQAMKRWKASGNGAGNKKKNKEAGCDIDTN
eukprot:578140-Ditylum_brightwellii.AAC.1